MTTKEDSDEEKGRKKSPIQNESKKCLVKEKAMKLLKRYLEDRVHKMTVNSVAIRKKKAVPENIRNV